MPLSWNHVAHLCLWPNKTSSCEGATLRLCPSKNTNMMWCEVWVNRSQSRFNCRKLIEERANVSSLTSVQNLKGRRLDHSQAIHASMPPQDPKLLDKSESFQVQSTHLKFSLPWLPPQDRSCASRLAPRWRRGGIDPTTCPSGGRKKLPLCSNMTITDQNV